MEVTSETKVTYTVKELLDDLKGDLKARIDEQDQGLNKRLDKQDVVLAGVDRRLDETAKKEDIREVHGRVDGVVRRLEPLEARAAAETAVAKNRARWKGNLAWLSGIIGVGVLIVSVMLVVVR